MKFTVFPQIARMAAMKIYFSVDPEVNGGESDENLKKLISFLEEEEGHKLYRSPYVYSENPDLFLQKEFGLDRKPTFPEQREIHIFLVWHN